MSVPAAVGSGFGQHDELDRLATAGHTLLTTTDAVLAASGVAPGDPLRPLLHRFRVLPGAVVASVVAWRPAPLHAAAAELRELALGYTAHATALAGAAVGWSGPAATAFAQHRALLLAHLGDPDPAAAPGSGGLAGQVLATAEYVESTATWLSRLRRSLAAALARAMTSAEAVRLAGPEDGTAGALRAGAAAAVGELLLATVADALTDGYALGSPPDELPWPPVPPQASGGWAAGTGGTTTIAR